MKKIVIFGAGKIGRSFIGQLFSRSGYEVVFIDLDQQLVELLNLHQQYTVVIKSDQDQVLNVQNVRAVSGSETEKVISELKTTDIVAVSVGKQALPKVLPVIAYGLKTRWEVDPDSKLDIILAENMRDAADFAHHELAKYLPEPEKLVNVGLIETSIGKMVPIMSSEELAADPLRVFAEPYNTLILDRQAFVNPVPDVEGLAPKDQMKAWVDRKTFIHNLGHAATAYLGYLYDPEFKYTYEVLEVADLKQDVRSTMQQAAEMLLHKYPEVFDAKALTAHIEDLLYRFANRSLGDTIFRVGLDLNRKLSPDDRLAGAIRLCLQEKTSFDQILYTTIAGMYFRAKDENGNLFEGDKSFAEHVSARGISVILKEVCGFEEKNHPQVFRKAEQMNKNIIDRFKPSFELNF